MYQRRNISFYQYAKANSKYLKIYNKNKESPYIQYWDVNNLQGWPMSEKLPINNFEWIEDTSQFNEGFIKNYNEESDKGYFADTKGLLRLKLTMVCYVWAPRMWVPKLIKKR